MTDITFFGNPDCLKPCPADRNKLLRQFFFTCAERSNTAGFGTQWFANTGQCVIIPGRLSVVWDRFGEPEIRHDYFKRFVDALYSVLQEQERRMLSRQLRYYEMSLNFQELVVRLDFLIPTHWPELYFWSPKVDLRTLVQNLAGKDPK